MYYSALWSAFLFGQWYLFHTSHPRPPNSSISSTGCIFIGTVGPNLTKEKLIQKVVAKVKSSLFTGFISKSQKILLVTYLMDLRIMFTGVVRQMFKLREQLISD